MPVQPPTPPPASVTVTPGPAVSADSQHVAPEAAPVEQTATQPVVPSRDVVLGVAGDSPQFGVLGKVMGRTVALDLNQTHTISLFGVQGGGKSYTLGSVIEMASLPIPGINLLPQPLAAVVFHKQR